MNKSFLTKTIERNLREFKDAIIMVRVMDQIDKTKTLHPLNFFKVACIALHNDVISHLCKVYEINGKGKSFWYIEKEQRPKVSNIALNHSISIINMKKISIRLKHIRNQTHFHIGSQNPINPNIIWEESDIKNYEIRELIKFGIIILIDLYHSISKTKYVMPDYDGSDVKDIITSYMKVHPNNGLSPNPQST